jgi:hypothetical protein
VCRREKLFWEVKKKKRKVLGGVLGRKKEGFEMGLERKEWTLIERKRPWPPWEEL